MFYVALTDSSMAWQKCLLANLNEFIAHSLYIVIELIMEMSWERNTTLNRTKWNGMRVTLLNSLFPTDWVNTNNNSNNNNNVCSWTSVCALMHIIYRKICQNVELYNWFGKFQVRLLESSDSCKLSTILRPNHFHSIHRSNFLLTDIKLRDTIVYWLMHLNKLFIDFHSLQVVETVNFMHHKSENEIMCE